MTVRIAKTHSWRSVLTSRFADHDQELAYRQHYLVQDRRIAAVGIITLLIANILYGLGDIFSGFSPSIVEALMAVRAVILVAGIALVWRLFRVSSPSQYDRLMLVWGAIMVVGVFSVSAQRPPGHVVYPAANLVFVFCFYLVFLSSLRWQVLCALLLTVQDAVIFMKFRTPLPGTVYWSVAVTYGFTHLIGIYTAYKLHVGRRRYYRALSKEKRLTGKLKRLAFYDSLTGVLVRRSFLERCRRELERVIRYQRPAALILIDLDFFKRINDQYGHAAGDAVLTEFANRVETERRETDIVGRLGGEEFALFLPETTAENAWHLAERIRRRCRDTPIQVDDRPIVLTISVGFASILPQEQEITEVLRRADVALYQAKNRGRDQVVPA